MAKGPALTYTEVLQEAIDTYHRHYEANKLWEQTRWLGQPMWKLPTDAIVLQEIIFETRPEFIIETGTGMGGSALLYASIQHLLDHGSVLTIDTARRFHNFGSTTVANRIRFIEGSSVEARTLELVGKEVSGRQANGLDPTRVRRQLEEIRRNNESLAEEGTEFRLLTGTEVDAFVEAARLGLGELGIG